MATAQQLTEGMAEIDAATNEIAAKIDTWRAGVSGPDSDRIRGEMTTAANRLRGLAKDPENPVP